MGRGRGCGVGGRGSAGPKKKRVAKIAQIVKTGDVDRQSDQCISISHRFYGGSVSLRRSLFQLLN